MSKRFTTPQVGLSRLEREYPVPMDRFRLCDPGALASLLSKLKTVGIKVERISPDGETVFFNQEFGTLVELFGESATTDSKGRRPRRKPRGF